LADSCGRGVTKISEPLIIPRAQHTISRALVSENALKVLYRLKDAGFAALLVGGCVRDLMLGREPKDFDVVTDARPEQIKELFRNARVIGRRFRLVHVHFGREIIEVATFRAVPRTIEEWAESDDVEDGEMLREDDEVGAVEPEAEPARRPPAAEPDDQNIFGTQEEDALRRDFTVNALYYNIRDFSVMDYVGGAEDLRAGVIRVIGDPETRYREDPVRMLRAVRFAAKLGLRIEDETAAPISRMAPLLATVPAARMFEEVLKLFHGGYALETYELLRHYGLFRYLFPMTEENLEVEEQGFPHTLVPQALANTDARVNDDKPVTPAFLFAAMLWEPVRDEAARLQANGMHPNEALQHAADEVLRQQIRHVAIPKRFSGPAREIWYLQSRLERRAGGQALRLMEHKRFRAAYDFLVLRAQVEEIDRELADWWTRFQEVGESERRGMVGGLAPAAAPGGKKRRRRRRRRKPAASGG
jgi:poly(A) polymerase